MSALDNFGVQGADLAPQAKPRPPRVNNRVAHIDADFLSYQIAADTRDELDGIRPLRTLDYKLGQIEDIAQEIMERAGASSYVLHVTPGGSNKGGRAEQAVQKEYQAQRQGRDKPEHLDIIRSAIGTGQWRFGKGMVHLDQEADDGMAQAGANDLVNAVVCSKDKDLRMSPGWKMDMETDELIFVAPDEFGTIAIDDTKSSKKLVGYGPKFFWAQCLMGDTVDNIQGLPAISGFDVQRMKDPELLRQNEKLYLSLDNSSPTWQRIEAAWVKTKSCGPVGAYDLLKDVDNNKDAFELVRALFNNLEWKSRYKFRHWKTGVSVTPTVALLGDMRLLWMRLTKNPDDVLRWLKQFV